MKKAGNTKENTISPWKRDALVYLGRAISPSFAKKLWPEMEVDTLTVDAHPFQPRVAVISR